MDLREIFPIQTEQENAGLRVDVFLSQKFPKVSRSRWKNLINKELLFVNDSLLLNASYLIKSGDVFNFDETLAGEIFQELDPRVILESRPKFIGTPPEVLGESSNYLVISKPIGLAVHPGAGLKFEQTLVCWALGEKLLESATDYSALMAWGDDVVEEFRPGIVHRLDQPTSGLMVIAKNPEAHKNLALQFSLHTAQRLYYALVAGHLQQLEKKLPRKAQEFLLKRPCPLALKRDVSGQVSLAVFLRRDPVSRTRFQVSPSADDGKKAISHFKPLSEMPVESHGQRYSWVEAKLETGRTHQIRVSLEFLGLPIVGDSVYSGIAGERLFLHAHHLEFDDPATKKRKSFNALWPKKDQHFLDQLGISYPEQGKI